MAQSKFSRRGFLGRTAGTLAYMGTPSIISAGNQAGGLPNLPHHKATAKRVIYLFQSGGPSHIDLFDYKPTLEKLHGTNLPDSVRGNQRVTGMTAGQKQFLVNKTVSPIKPRGQSGVTISDLLPYTAGIADDICLVKSVHTEAINHDPGITFINTGSQIPGLPSLGAWCNYGLGSNNRDMPGYIVMLSQGKGKNPGQPIFSRLWGSGFIPSSHQGVQLRGGGTPILYLDDPKGIDRKSRRKMLDDIAKLNAMRLDQSGDPEIATRNFQYDMAYRMQASAPEITDLSDEPESTFKLYGEDARIPGTYAYNCLLARRMAERDVRFIQLFHR
ncbi:MAG TPA: sulfatase, partial [Verrucomicrobiales bacterium]|nr:sulfatase [Verrucomicrobiales bacterium]